jgi:predicted nucleic acid-binding protein
MPLDLPDGAACFVDANIFYYHFVETVPFSDPCTDFLKRVAKAEVKGYASAHVLAEAIHKVMLAEAAERFALNRAGLANWLQHHQDRIAELSQFRQAAEEFTLGLHVLPIDGTLLVEAAQVSIQTGLLTNDAITVALLRRHGIPHLATNDADFHGIEGLTAWRP